MRVQGSVQVYDNVRKLMGEGLYFERQDFFMALLGVEYEYNGAHETWDEVQGEVEGAGYRREVVKFEWLNAGTEMKLMFSPVTFFCRGAPYKVARWLIYRAQGRGDLMFSGHCGESWPVMLTEGDDLQISPDSNGLLRLG